MNSMSLRVSTKKPMGEFSHDDGRFEIRCTDEIPSAALVLPEKDGLHVGTYQFNAPHYHRSGISQGLDGS
jgi:hypothetical protein